MITKRKLGYKVFGSNSRGSHASTIRIFEIHRHTSPRLRLIYDMKKQFSFAVIFDMDGVIVDNHNFHLKAWQRYFKVLGKKITKEYFEKYLFGRTNCAILTTVLKRKVSDIEVQKCAQVKERLYRKLYAPKIKPLKGLRGFIKELKSHRIRIALATSGPQDNVQFMLEKTKLKKYFNIALDDRFVKHSKPHPEIYLKAAERLKFRPPACVVFEDS